MSKKTDKQKIRFGIMMTTFVCGSGTHSQLARSSSIKMS